MNAYDVEVDEKCVELLALHQPAAGDLRFITTAMKIVTDLERIGDQAVNIAQRALELNHEPQLKPYIDLPRMAERAQRDGEGEPRRVRGPRHRAGPAGLRERTPRSTRSTSRSSASC